ncbi:hypothetical protein [Vampirovibrio chlorellavorus]|uniref:hypothetical protein n=1 Tax=Vampirovibrio chlorellavorus TaxID=758823 RepID=UPI0026E957C6|nr:hypothetical protein [Vampirovibrio chlorellavorus]
MPTTNGVSNSVNAIASNGLGKTPLGLFTLGALGFAAWRMQDAFVGSKQEVDQKISGLKTTNDYDYGSHVWGQYSGNPGMDRLDHKFQGLLIYGPLRLKEHWQSFKIRVGNFFSNVVGPNLLPLGVGLAGLYGTIGHQTMSGYGRNIADWWNRSNFFDSTAWKTLKGVGGSLGSGLWTVIKSPVKLMFKSPQHFAVGSGVALIGAFFLKRFTDTVNGDAQRDFFRDDLYSSQHDVR